MSTIKKDNKEIYDGIKLNTESKERIIDELVNRIESNSNSNEKITELDQRRIEKMKRNEGIEKLVKVCAVACFSVLASGLVIAGVINFKNNNNGTKAAKGTVGETVSETIKETDNVETQPVIDEKDNNDEFWNNCEYSMNFEEISRPDYINEKKGCKGDFEFEYSDCDIDGDGNNDTVNLKIAADKEGMAKGTIVVSINGKETKTLEFDGIKNNEYHGEARNVKLIKMWDGNCFVYCDFGNLTCLTYQTMFSLKDYEMVMDSTSLPYMSSLRDIVINKDTSSLYFFYWTQFNYVAGTGYQYYVEYADGKFDINADEEYGCAEVMPFKIDSMEVDSSFRQEYVLSEDREFYLDEDKSGRKITLKKGEKLIYAYARFNRKTRKDEKDAWGYSTAYDMCCFYVDDEDKKGKIKVYLDPVEEGKEYYETEIFDDTSWAQ